jgi:hypothetical protein
LHVTGTHGRIQLNDAIDEFFNPHILLHLPNVQPLQGRLLSKNLRYRIKRYPDTKRSIRNDIRNEPFETGLYET